MEEQQRRCNTQLRHGNWKGKFPVNSISRDWNKKSKLGNDGGEGGTGRRRGGAEILVFLCLFHRFFSIFFSEIIDSSRIASRSCSRRRTRLSSFGCLPTGRRKPKEEIIQLNSSAVDRRQVAIRSSRLAGGFRPDYIHHSGWVMADKMGGGGEEGRGEERRGGGGGGGEPMQSHGRTERLTLFAQAIIVYPVAWLSGGHRQNKWTAATHRRSHPITRPPGDAVNTPPLLFHRLLSSIFPMREMVGKSSRRWP